jgi:molybdopterin-guanine dinucleotide biosynthesis protein B
LPIADQGVEHMPPIICIVGQSDSGKTTLMEKLIPELKARGLRIGTVKHAFHGFDMDREGKDSWRHHQAGADAVAVASPHQTAIIKTVAGDSLETIAAHLKEMDLILVEGYKRARRPKIEVVREATGKPPACAGDPYLLAVATDTGHRFSVPTFGLTDAAGLADLIQTRFQGGSSG